MNIRLRAKDIEIPAKEPFKNDLLDRQESAETLKNLVRNIESPNVIAVDANWGTGKTTFLKMWVQALRDQGLPVVEFNAWENDFSTNAMVSLSAELTSQLREYKMLVGVKDELKDKAIEVIKDTVTASVKISTGGLLNLDLGEDKSDVVSNYKQYQSLLTKFRKNLNAIATDIKEEKNFPLVIVIDELDRCRPLYAIQILEAAKHVFSIENIVFVLAMNRTELGHSIRAIYGDKFDSYEYLKRFIDVDFRLPQARRNDYLNSVLSENAKTMFGNRHHFHANFNLMLKFYGIPEFNLRTAANYIRRLDLILASLAYNPDEKFLTVLIVALICRSVDSESYFAFHRGEFSDEELANSIFGRISDPNLRLSNEGTWIEGIIMAVQKYRDTDDSAESEKSYTSALYNSYLDLADDATVAERRHAHAVIEFYDRHIRDTENFNIYGSAYFHAVKLIENIVPSDN